MGVGQSLWVSVRVDAVETCHDSGCRNLDPGAARELNTSKTPPQEGDPTTHAKPGST